MAGRARSRSVTYGQLVLFAALLFGIVTMHTVGHPAEHGGSAASSSAAMAEHADPAQYPALAPAPAPAVADAPHPSSPHDSPGTGAPMSGMDPLSVCLAVLGVWGLALLGSRLFGLRAGGRPLMTPVGAGLLRALRPIPPPPIPVLAGVSVLRI